MRTFHVTVTAADAEIAADRLWQLGVEAVGVDERPDGTVELWTAVGEAPASIDRAVATLAPGWHWELRDVVEPADTWREHVAPTWYAERGVVVPAWQADEFENADDVLVTVIEPANSFGLGDHPTTASSLALLSAHMQAAAPRRVLDVGCGSGVLGIVAAQAGAAAVRSIDISAAAIEATVANAERNGVAARIVADTSPLARIDERYDLVAANILAPVLVALADDLVRVVAPTGALLISGILDDAHDHVLGALAPLHVRTSRRAGGWISVLLSR